MISRLLRWLVPCAHAHTWIERREIDGVSVVPLVCDQCGHAAPAITRSRSEYQRGREQQVLLPRATVVQPPSAAERARVLASVSPLRRAK
jgi:hypothetical protein